MKSNRQVLRAALALTTYLPAVVLSLAWVSSAQAAHPRGVRLLVRSYFYVPNSSDGFKDIGVEAYGSVYFNGQWA